MASLAASSAKRQRSRSGSQPSSTLRVRQGPPVSKSVPTPVPAATTSASGNADIQVNNVNNVNNSSLPAGTDMRTWRRVFIPTVFQYIARQPNPWAIPPRQIIPVMQIMWDAFFGDIPQEITATSVIYRLVSSITFIKYIDIVFLFRLCNASPTPGVVQSDPPRSLFSSRS